MAHGVMPMTLRDRMGPGKPPMDVCHSAYASFSNLRTGSIAGSSITAPICRRPPSVAMNHVVGNVLILGEYKQSTSIRAPEGRCLWCLDHSESPFPVVRSTKTRPRQALPALTNNQLLAPENGRGGRTEHAWITTLPRQSLGGLATAALRAYSKYSAEGQRKKRKRKTGKGFGFAFNGRVSLARNAAMG